MDDAADRALTLIVGDDPVADLYRVSIGTASGALPLVMAADDGLAALWGVGTAAKARTALAVWASTICLYLRQNDADRRSTIAELGENFAFLFGIDAALIFAELSVLDLQRIIVKQHAEGRNVTSYPSVGLYLRLRRALGDGDVPHFSRLPDELSALALGGHGLGVLYPALSSIVLVSRIFTESLRAAYETFRNRGA